MKICAFQIKNYKSVRDSRWCFLSEDITILAGKNESGKTAILEALRDADTSITSFEESVYPLDESSNETPNLALRVMCDDNDREKLKEHHPDYSSIIDDVFDGIVDILKYVSDDNGDAEYRVPELSRAIKGSHTDHLASFKGDYSDALLNYREELVEHYSFPDFPKARNFALLKGFSIDIENRARNHQSDINSEAKKRAENRLNNLPDNASDEQKSAAKKIEYTEHEDDRLTALGAMLELSNSMQSTLDDEYALTSDFAKLLPNFVFFSSFDDVLPFEIAISEAKKNSAVQDFFEAADIDIEHIAARSNKQRRDNALRTRSLAITGDFQEFWKQDQITLRPHIDGKNIVFEFEEEGQVATFSFEQRSKGFQWFLTFYLKLMVEGSKTKGNVLLIDEPGLYLHAKAQKDVLKLFERLAKNGFRIVISTHSPYLIDVDNIQRLKLVQRNKSKGTYISNKVHSDATLDTLTPIKTAIGINVGPTLHSTHKNNLITEGVSDYHYLQALRAVSERELSYSIIPSTGSTNVGSIASILIGWGFEVAGLFDNDSGGKAGAKRLAHLALPPERILIPYEKGGSIEELFSSNDFLRIVLEADEDRKSLDTNKATLKALKEDKMLVSLKFLQRINDKSVSVEDLSIETRENFARLYSQIEAAFS